MTLYTVTDWINKYENNRTRELKRMDWVPIPNKHDGDGYTELVTMQDGAGLFGCWVAILQIASKCKPRGRLIRETGEPHTAQSLSRMSHLPAAIMSRALSALVQVRWLDSTPYENTAESRNAVRESAIPSVPFHSIPFSPEGGLGETIETMRRELCAYWKKPENERWDNDAEHYLVEVCKSPKAIQEWELIKAHYGNAGVLKRQSLSSLLQHWVKEIEKARTYEPPPQKDRAGNIIKPQNLLMPKMSRLEREDV